MDKRVHLSINKTWSKLKGKFTVMSEPVRARLKEIGLSGIAAVLLINLLGLSGLLSASVFAATLPVSKTGEEKLVVIEQGMSTYEIAEMLEAEGLIRSGFVFRLLANAKGMQASLKAGIYQLSPGQGMQEIMEVISSGGSISQDIQVTIPEGLTVLEMAGLLSEKGLVSEDEFLRAASVVPESYPIEERPDVDYPLEGYLFPDTYRFPREVTAQMIVERMLDRFMEVVVEGRSDELAKQELSLHEVVTLASIVEREAQLDRERPDIAKVFLNRLEYGLKLQSCPTVEYALGEHKPILTDDDTAIDSPYNTYKYYGLPPGPIAAPGLDSIDAIFNPSDVDYLYFAATGNGDHLFARTYQEHLANVRRIRSGS